MEPSRNYEDENLRGNLMGGCWIDFGPMRNKFFILSYTDHLAANHVDDRFLLPLFQPHVSLPISYYESEIL